MIMIIMFVILLEFVGFDVFVDVDVYDGERSEKKSEVVSRAKI